MAEKILNHTFRPAFRLDRTVNAAKIAPPNVDTIGAQSAAVKSRTGSTVVAKQRPQSTMPRAAGGRSPIEDLADNSAAFIEQHGNATRAAGKAADRMSDFVGHLRDSYADRRAQSMSDALPANQTIYMNGDGSMTHSNGGVVQGQVLHSSYEPITGGTRPAIEPPAPDF